MRNPRTSLAAKWLFYQVLGFSLILGIALVVQYNAIRQQIYGNVRNTGASVIGVLQEILIDNPQILSSKTLDTTLDRFVARIPGISRIQMRDVHLEVIADTAGATPAGGAKEPSQTALQDVVQDGQEVSNTYQAEGREFYQLVWPIYGKYDPVRKSTVSGIITIDMHLSNADRKVRQTFQATQFIVGGLFLLFLVLQYGMMKMTFLRPLSNLTQAIQQFGHRSDTAPVAEKTRDELGQLELTFNRMAADIQQTHAALELEITERIQGEAERIRLSQHIRQLLESSGEGIYGIDREGRCTFINRMGAATLGYAPEELLGTDIHRQIHHSYPDGRGFPAEECPIRNIFHTGQACHVDNEVFWRSDGSAFAAAYSAHPLLDGAEIQGAVVTFRDITEQKQAQEAARQLAAIVESTDDAILSISLDRTITNWNKGAQQLYGYAQKEIIGQPISRLIPASNGDEFTWLREKILLGEGVQDYETLRVGKDGIPIDVVLTMSPIKNAEGTITGISTIARDNRMRKQVEQEFKRAKEAAEAADRAKSEFLANMSHEIRTPLNGIIGLTELLMQRDFPPEATRYMEVIRQSGETLLTVINDILDFSKIEAGKLSFEIIDFNLVQMVEDTVNTFAERAGAKHLELASHIFADVPVALRSDPFRLGQILTNLLANAIKFTEQGEVVVRVQRIEENEQTAVLRFEVIDSGIGLTGEQQERLFQPFSQADASTTRKYGGTGLGLAISTQLVKLLGGEIGVQSTPGQGSVFWCTLPLEKQPANAQASLPKRSNLRGLSVLVVDDNPTNRSILYQQTLAWEMRNGCAADGPGALDMLRAGVAAGQPYDVVLLDMNMPGMDGIAVTKEIKAEPTLAHTAIIMLTSGGQRGLNEELQQAGVAVCLPKPIRQSELYDHIMIALHRTDDQNRVHIQVARPSLRTPDYPSAPVPTGIRLLVVEDNAINQQVIVGILTARGYQTDVVDNGREALAAMETSTYAAILMDCQMPVMDGYAASAEIRTREGSARHTPIIAMTANALPGEREKCLAAGMDDYLIKPARPAQIYAVLNHWIAASAPDPAEPPVQEQLPASPETILNPTILANLRSLQPDNPAFLNQLVDLFVQDTSARLAQLRELLHQGDANQIARTAHTLIGSCANLGVRPMVELCQRLELLAQAGTLEPIASLADQLDAAFAQAQVALNAERTKGGANADSDCGR